MAITRILKINETKTKGGKHSIPLAGNHLKNSLKYILNPEKTKGGLLTGSNISTDAMEAYHTMIDTKKEWNQILGLTTENEKENKLFGRQGYHFVISWQPGECDSQTAYQVIREFCEEYLKDSYEYAFAVHTDKEHMHGHIVFNSVNRETGYKWRYEKGDWKKYIQPVTDRICLKHGLQKLTYKDKRKGKSYAEHMAEKNGKMTATKIIRSDIDYAINHAETFEEFIKNMKNFGYKIREGNSKKHGAYLAYRMPVERRERMDYNLGSEIEDKKVKRRDYSLGKGYRIEDIKERIRLKNFTYYERQTPRLVKARLNGSLVKKTYMNRYQVRFVRRLHQAGAFYKLKNPYAVNQRQVRQDMMQIDRLAAECRYLLRAGIRSEGEVSERLNEVKKMETYLAQQLYTKDAVKKEELVRKLSDVRKEKRILAGIVKEGKNVPDFGTRKAEKGKSIPEHPAGKENPYVRRK
ncbi:MAG: relaxase/mobilization nuclease domain-containing protein [Lachnospiraceae bacterium]|nr:relaxase/mobilization nuclease domain-containing protein [Lachnospiraceae bacterium]